MLLRICLIVAIVAGLAAGGLNFVKVKEKITTLVQQRDSEKSQKEAAQTELASTKTELKKTTAELAQTKTTLEATVVERDKAAAEAAKQTALATKLTEDLTKTRQERDDSQSQLAAYKNTGMTPDQIVKADKTIKGLQDELAGVHQENLVLGKQLKKATSELAFYKGDKPVQLPAGLKGKVLVSDPKWNFVVLNVGEDQGILEHGELLINRNGRLVAKVIVSGVQKDRSVANVMPGWQLGEVLEGDQVIAAHPAS